MPDLEKILRRSMMLAASGLLCGVLGFNETRAGQEPQETSISQEEGHNLDSSQRKTLIKLNIDENKIRSLLDMGIKFWLSLDFIREDIDTNLVLEYKPALDRGYSATDVFLLTKSKIRYDIARPYIKLNYNGIDIWSLISEGVTSLEARDGAKYKNIGLEGLAFALAVEYNFRTEDINKGIGMGLSGLDVSLLLSQRVPLEYARLERQKLAVNDIICKYFSSARNATIDEKLTKAIFGENIKYVDFHELKVQADKTASLPKDLGSLMMHRINNWRIDNYAWFHQMVLNESKRLGYTVEDIKKLAPERAIGLAIEITVDKLDYKDGVKPPLEMTKRYGNVLPIDYYLKIGQANCQGYTAAVIAIFEELKEINPMLNNVFVTSSYLAGNEALFVGREGEKGHIWNTIVVIEKGRLVMSQIDATRFGNHRQLYELEADERHVDKEHLTEKFYKSLEPYKNPSSTPALKNRD